MLPGGASKPVWRIALLPLLAPERMSVLFPAGPPAHLPGRSGGPWRNPPRQRRSLQRRRSRSLSQAAQSSFLPVSFGISLLFDRNTDFSHRILCEICCFNVATERETVNRLIDGQPPAQPRPVSGAAREESGLRGAQGASWTSTRACCRASQSSPVGLRSTTRRLIRLSGKTWNRARRPSFEESAITVSWRAWAIMARAISASSMENPWRHRRSARRR